MVLALGGRLCIEWHSACFCLLLQAVVVIVELRGRRRAWQGCCKHAGVCVQPRSITAGNTTPCATGLVQRLPAAVCGYMLMLFRVYAASSEGGSFVLSAKHMNTGFADTAVLL